MNTTKLTREEALRRWSASKKTKRKMVEKLETLVRNSCLERGDLENLKQYIMEKVIVDVAWCDRNYGGSLGGNVLGAVVFTAPSFEALQKEAKDSLEFHVEGLVENGEDVPEWLKNGDYEFVYNYQDATTLLKAYSPYVSLAAISRASGINQSLLSHYVNGLKKPREQQRKRIVDGLHKIGSDLQSVMCV